MLFTPPPPNPQNVESYLNTVLSSLRIRESVMG